MDEIMCNNKKVLLITRSLTNGGAEKVMSIIANGLAIMGLDVTLAVMEDKEKTYYVDKKVNLVQFTYKSNNKIMKSFERLYKLRILMSNNEYNTVISFLHIINFYTLVSGLGLNKNIIISERADPSKNKQWYIKLGRKILYPLADKIVFQTKQAQEFFPEYIKNKSIIIANPVSKNLPQVYKGKRENIVVAAGRLTEQKNFKMSIDAFAKLIKEYEDLELHIYGDGIMKTEILRYIKDSGLCKKVKLLGYINNLPERIYKSKIYISSSNYEGISNSMLEALALGIPTIVTDCPVGGAKMVIKNNYNGILVPVGDVNALYDEMKKVLKDEEFSNKISKNSIKVRSDYSVENICKQWSRLIN